MKTFENVRFNGTFRDYQQSVLDNAGKHLADKKIHIVAAPGSGKTILGLELIRRLNAPALVFSPSVTIRQQWGERFSGKFLPDGANGEEYLSYSLKTPALITSVTYQALHAAYNKSVLEAEKDEETDEAETNEDFSGFDLMKTIKTSGIKTICLDEAHHLRSEWQKALEEFIKKLGTEVTVISLTATPPYDSTAGEWQKYAALCGEIDDEIFVPQLVGQKTLCPHQDYIHFSYPTAEEENAINEYGQKAQKCASDIITNSLYAELLEKSRFIVSYNSLEETILDNEEGARCFLGIANYQKTVIPKKLLELISCEKQFPPFTLKSVETAFQFVLDKPEIFSEESAEKLRKTLSAEGLIDRRKVSLASSDKLDKLLITSMGKLSSIQEIASAETKLLGDKLRMLVLTDFIKKDMLKIIGTDENITSMGTVPIFEAIRRSAAPTTKIGVLSGGLVIVPDTEIEKVKELANGIANVSAKPLNNTGYSEITFSGSNKNKVAIITEAFQKGCLNILVGTKSLLGEGWDSPCINSLILASFVGSFMLSNQMRGRAIRTDFNVPDKTSSIWHLTTVVPDAKKTELDGADWETLKRRFDCFVAPAYNRNSIESGIERIDIIAPPYSKENIDMINAKTMALSADRAAMAQKWNGTVNNSGRKSAVTDEVEMPAEVKPKSFIISNLFLQILIFMIFAGFIVACNIFILPMNNIFISVCAAVVGIVLCVWFFKKLGRLMRFASPQRTVKCLIRCVFNTLKQMGEIDSKNAKISVTTNNYGNKKSIGASLVGATAHESGVFAKAVGELLSPIDNPRYVVLAQKGNRYNYKMSYACPSLIGVNKENAEILANQLKRMGLTYGTIFTRSQDGKKELIKCKKCSYINRNSKILRNRKIAKLL